MDAREQHLVVSVSARPSSWPLVERPWLRASKGVHDAIQFNPHAGIAACAAQAIGKLSDCQARARTCARVTSHCTTSTAPIQYP